MPASARAFLDANVLFSAAYLEHSALCRLWEIRDAEVVSSAHAIEEARRNLALSRPAAIASLERLLSTVGIVNPPHTLKLPPRIRLEEKDRPVLLAAIAARADYLITGDQLHFGHLYGKRVEGVLVVRPAQFLERHSKQ